MYSVSIRAQTLPELKSRMQAMLVSLDGEKISEAQPAPAQSLLESEKPKRGRKPKETAAPVTTTADTTETRVSAPTETKTVEPVRPIMEPAPKEITVEELRTALNKVSTKHGMQTSIKILKDYGANRISELPKEKHAAFIDACAASIA